MGLSVGVVSIDYLDEPQPPVSDFLKELVLNPGLGIDDWGGGWVENTFLEFQKLALMKRARKWCAENGICASGLTALTTWLSRLPWRDGYVMLHLGE